MLRNGLYTRVIGKSLVYFRRLSSTMDEAARLAQDGAEEGTVVLAEEQTAGRGRFQRTWVSEPGNLYLSVVLRPSLEELRYLGVIPGLAVARAITKATGLRTTIKWPNDVRVSGRKVSGILVESALEADIVKYAVLGVGVNVALNPAVIDELADIATSLNVETGKPIDREALLGHLLQEIDRLYQVIRESVGRDKGSLDRVTGEWRALLETLGRQVEVRWQNEVYHGYAEDVDEVGNLRLRLGDGTLATLPAGEVTSGLSLAQ